MESKGATVLKYLVFVLNFIFFVSPVLSRFWLFLVYRYFPAGMWLHGDAYEQAVWRVSRESRRSTTCFLRLVVKF